MKLFAAVAASALLLAAPATFADTTAPAGGGLPQDTIQPSVALNYLIQTEGIFQNLGDIRIFAGNFAPSGFMLAQGQTLAIADHDTLFNVLGTTYGGDGQFTFMLPDLRGRAPIGATPFNGSPGPGLSNYALGQTVGTEGVTLTTANLPTHDHTLPPPGGGNTSNTGSGTPYNNMQPSLALNYNIPQQGIFPSRDGSNPVVSTDPMLGTIELTASTLMPNGSTSAAGQILQISQNTALFSILGTTYGGNGVQTFALPDLRGRTPIGAGQAPGLTNQNLGQVGGVENVALTEAQMAPHLHGLPPSADLTGVAGSGLPQDNMQPTLGLHYIISLGGIFPPRDDPTPDPDSQPFYGEIELFAGNFAPSGWAFADGQIMSISQNTALFSILGTTYGGNGQTTFALPDLRDALVVGAGQGPGLQDWTLGEVQGSEQNVMTQSELPTHTHSYEAAVVADAPEPGTLAVLGLGLAGLGLARRRR